MDYTGDTIYVQVESSNDSDLWVAIARGMLFFPETADIPDGSTVTAASLFLYVNVKADTFGGMKLQVVSATPASESSLITGDFDQFGTTVLGEIAVADIVESAYNEIVLDTSAINKTGTTILGLRFSKDVSNDSTYDSHDAALLSIGSAEHATPSHRPFLTTTY